VPDKTTIPIAYRQENDLESLCPVLVVTSHFLKNVNLEEVKVKRETVSFGTKDFPGILFKTGIDFNADGQNEILLYHEEVKDNVTDEGDENSAYSASVIAMYFGGKWFRTSYWEEGQDGLEGF
jgi:hypothetical protein